MNIIHFFPQLVHLPAALLQGWPIPEHSSVRLHVLQLCYLCVICPLYQTTNIGSIVLYDESIYQFSQRLLQSCHTLILKISIFSIWMMFFPQKNHNIMDSIYILAIHVDCELASFSQENAAQAISKNIEDCWIQCQFTCNCLFIPNNG